VGKTPKPIPASYNQQTGGGKTIPKKQLGKGEINVIPSQGNLLTENQKKRDGTPMEKKIQGEIKNKTTYESKREYSHVEN